MAVFDAGWEGEFSSVYNSSLLVIAGFTGHLFAHGFARIKQLAAAVFRRQKQVSEFSCIGSNGLVGSLHIFGQLDEPNSLAATTVWYWKPVVKSAAVSFPAGVACR